MSYYEVSDFKAGIDLRKSAVTAPAGTLRQLENAHVTQGGEIEKRRAYSRLGTLPDTTFGLMELNGSIYTVRRAGDGGTVDGPFTVIDLPMPSGTAIAKFLDWDLFNGKLYVVVQDVSGNVQHFYDGAYVSTGKGVNVRTYKEKVYGLDGRTLYFSAVGDPTTWVDPPPVGGVVAHNGSGFIDVGANDADSENLVGMEVYYDKLALFSKLCTQLWFLDPDPAKNTYFQTLRDAGTVAPLSVRQFTASDVYFLGPHGVRSLRARDMTLTAAISDVGSPIDNIFINLGVTAGQAYLAQAISILSPRTGRFHLILPNDIYVLANYQSPAITAWGRYDPPGAVVAAVYADPNVVLRTSDGGVWAFSGLAPSSFDNSPVTVQLPFLSFDKPCETKRFVGLDVACAGEWYVYASFDPANPDAQDLVAIVNGPTFSGGRIPLNGWSTHIQLTFKCTSGDAATLGKVFIHYQEGQAD